LTSDGKEAVGKTIGFADVRLQTRTGPMRGWIHHLLQGGGMIARKRS
jgi:hypothetical protein